MNGPAHYAEAENCLGNARHASDNGRDEDAAFWQREAQVHATLAVAAAVVDGPAVMRPEDRDEWDRATGRLQPGGAP